MIGLCKNLVIGILNIMILRIRSIKLLRKLSYPKQKLFCLAPSTIIDSNFTKLRKDQKNVTKSINQNPKKRGIFSREVSEIIYEIMFKKKFDYLSNTVIHLDGGKFARM